MKIILLALTGIGVFSVGAGAQIIDPKEAAKRKTTDRVNQRADQSIDKGLDKVEEGIGNIFKKKNKNKEKEKPVSPADTEKEKTQRSSERKTGSESTDFSEYRNFDFVPGKTVLLFEDFSSGVSQWGKNEWDPGEHLAPGVAVVGEQQGKWYKMPKKGMIFPLQLKDLPDEFTLEFDMYCDLDLMSEMEGGLKTIFVKSPVNRSEFDFHFNTQPQVQLEVHPSLELMYVSATTEYKDGERTLFHQEYKNGWKKGQVRRISIYRSKTHVALYIDQTKYITLPSGLPQSGKYSLLFATNLWGDGTYLTNIRLATGSSKPETELTEFGKFSTTSIYFDVNSARIKPESWATLKETAAAIQSATGDILIIGHTDSDGAEEANLILSEKRAASVKAALVNEFAIPEIRLKSSGKGESVPVEPNTSASGKAKNRRVEFIRQ